MPGVLAALGSGFVAAALLLACSEPDAGRSAETKLGAPPNVLMLLVDTLRADDLGLYGSERGTSPFIDSLGARGVVFENATSTAAWTLPAHASLFSGVYPTRHGVRSFREVVPHRYATLPGLLGKHGYATAAVFNLQALRTMRRGFDRVLFVPDAQDEAGATGRVANRALGWLAGATPPWFLFLHFYDVHSDYQPKPSYALRFAAPYDGPATGRTDELRAFRKGEADLDEADVRHLHELYRAGIRQFDDDLRSVFAALEARGHLDEDTLVVLTSDHGEEFFDHGSVLHGRTLHQELVRVPLIFAGAGLPAGVRVAEPVSLVDLLPTVLALLGVPAPDDIDGVDVSGLWNGAGPAGRPLVAEANHWIGNDTANFRRALRRGSWTLHYDAESDRSALYDLREDPTEQRDVASRFPEIASELRRELAPFVPETRPVTPPEPPEDLVETLRRLGYVDGEAPAER